MITVQRDGRGPNFGLQPESEQHGWRWSAWTLSPHSSRACLSLAYTGTILSPTSDCKFPILSLFFHYHQMRTVSQLTISTITDKKSLSAHALFREWATPLSLSPDPTSLSSCIISTLRVWDKVKQTNKQTSIAYFYSQLKSDPHHRGGLKWQKLMGSKGNNY